LNRHTAPDWHRLSDQDKNAAGMVMLTDSLAKAQVCAGCHVGAPADQAAGMPLREVNHDLLAAGHPRLNFELTAFLVNLPPHWDRAQQRPDANERARTWLIGQIGSAQAAARLVADRAERGQGIWPEFAEYDCQTCHHGLRESRRHPLRSDQPGAGRLAGEARWGSWYWAMPSELARLTSLGGNPEMVGTIESLAASMEGHTGDRRHAVGRAKDAALMCAAWQERLRHVSEPARAVHDDFWEAVISSDRAVLSNWETAEQLYLAASAFWPPQSERPDEQLRRRESAFHRLSVLLAYPSGQLAVEGISEAEFRSLLRQVRP
jgi:hypothetical protein